ncbi:hypothetical protein RUM43_000736 [Polyplax serrata]|uniref:Thiamin pyrophosphokinase thiamin-binding domain-containing protein n=1 Tax=Polyplax serrata TaxID=468196 RepID=A0AAN8XP29_POLSC
MLLTETNSQVCHGQEMVPFVTKHVSTGNQERSDARHQRSQTRPAITSHLPSARRIHVKEMAKHVSNVLHLLKASALAESEFSVLVLNQPIHCNPQLMKLLWRKATVRALADGGSNEWLEFIEKESDTNFQLPDFISGDFDSMTQRTRTYFESRGVTFIPTPDQDETDFTKALRCLDETLATRGQKVNPIFVVCETTGRFDHIMGNINTLHRSISQLPSLSIIMLSSQDVTWLLPAGNNVIQVPDEYIKSKLKCGLIPFRGSTLITTSGLKWNMSGEVTEFGQLVSTSNTFAENEVTVDANQHLIWTTEYVWS